jgi:ABC-type nickel/cobalt efflux system permease component RcnA
MLAVAGGLALLILPWLVQVSAVVILAVAIWIFWHACRPIFEEERTEPFSQREEES